MYHSSDIIGPGGGFVSKLARLTACVYRSTNIIGPRRRFRIIDSAGRGSRVRVETKFLKFNFQLPTFGSWKLGVKLQFPEVGSWKSNFNFQLPEVKVESWARESYFGLIQRGTGQAAGSAAPQLASTLTEWRVKPP